MSKMSINDASGRSVYRKSFLEIKEALISASSLLNTYGFGYIYFGVDKQGKISSIKNVRQGMNDLSKEILLHLRPIPKVSIVPVEGDAGIIVKASFSGSLGLYSAYGNYYLQERGADSPMTAEQLLSRLPSHRMESFSVDGHLDGALDEKRLIETIRRGYDSHRLSDLYMDAETALSRLGLLDKRGNAEKEAFLLFGDSKPVQLKKMFYDDRGELVDYSTFKGNILDCVQEGIRSVYPRFTHFRKVVSDDFSDQMSNFSFLNEALVNAYSHLDYTKSNMVEIKITKEYVSISNDTDKENFNALSYIKNIGGSTGDNPLLLIPLYLGGYTKRIGGGISEIAKECHEKRIRFEMKIEDGKFVCVFYRKEKEKNVESPTPADKASGPIRDPDDDALTLLDLRILNALKEKPDMTIPELSVALGKSQATIHRYIVSLMNAGKLIRRGARKNGYWEVVTSSRR